MPIIAGPLVNVTRGAMPEWVEGVGGDYARLRDQLYDFMEAVVSRYIQYVGIWKVASGLHIVEDQPLKPEEMVDLTQTAVLLVRQNRRGARTMVELDDLFGDLAAKRAGSLGAFEYLEQIKSEGIRFDCLGARLVVGGVEPSERTRDIMTVSDMLDEFLYRDMPLLLSACAAPAIQTGPTAGSWGEAWSDERQATWASRIIPMALSKPFVEAVIWGQHRDRDSADGFGLVNAQGEVRSAHGKLLSMKRRLQKPLGTREKPASESSSEQGGKSA
jgi:hypothetical protein